MTVPLAASACSLQSDRKKRMKSALSVVLLLALASTAFAKDQILCKPSERGSDVVITLSSFEKFGRTFNCVSGDFVVDLSGCAPPGAFAIHAPTGTAPIVDVVDRWQDLDQHTGGVMYHVATDEILLFDGGYVGFSGWKSNWKFSVSRLTGVGKLTQTSGPAKQFKCRKAAQKF